MLVDILNYLINGVICMGVLAIVLFGPRWFINEGRMIGREEMKAEMELEAINASNAKLQLEEEARKLAEAL